MSNKYWLFSSLLIVGIFIIGQQFSCTPPSSNIIQTSYPDSTISIHPDRATELTAQILSETSASVPEGLELSLWASDSIMSDPIAISVDEQGGIYYTQGNRIQNSEFDIRGHRDWMTESVSWQHVEERRAFLRRTFTDDSDAAKEFLIDLNNDGVLNWKDLTVEKEDVWRVSDKSGDGIADHARLYISDFHEEISDLANGVESFDGDVYVAVGPDLWKTTDNNGDGIADTKTSLGHGFAVHIGFGAHGMSGVTVGPDGRIYWGIGDIGMNLVDQTGKQWKYPNRGVIVRCEPDGSNFEVFSHGHRNTHEFVFDKYGNLISEDNDGDHRGERERLVYIINGSDSGWRINWQFGKYTDPKNNKYKVWMDEKLSIPHWQGQAAYILPPIQNYINGPTGMVYNPGTALSPEWKDHFFIAEFRGSPSNSPIHAFTLKPDGAGFALDQTREVTNGLLPTGLDFGPDGALYFGDWITGWQAKSLGRIWKLDVPGGAESAIRKTVKNIIQSDFNTKPIEELESLLGHEDMRIRTKAQFELVKRGEEGYNVMQQVATASSNQLARIHGLWGMGQISRSNQSKGSDLIAFVNDTDEEIVAQALKLLGDIRFKAAEKQVVSKVNHANPRVRLHATEALGRMESKAGSDAIIQMIRNNDGQDMWLRHAGMIALGRIGDADKLVGLKNDPSLAVRLAAVVALRRMEHAGIATYLDDKDELVVTEAARGINDDWSIEAALPALAEVLNRNGLTSEPLIRRAINANLRVGKLENLQYLMRYANNKSAPNSMRAEAIAVIGTWDNPSVLDRVDGRYRGVVTRDKASVVALVMDNITGLFKDSSNEVIIELSKAIARLGIVDGDSYLETVIRTHQESAVRAAAMTALSNLDSGKKRGALEFALADKASEVRANALKLIPESDLTPQSALLLFEPILADGSVEEKQSAYASLGQMQGNDVTAVLKDAFNKIMNGQVIPEVHLDILSAIEVNGDPALLADLENYTTALSEEDAMAEYRAALLGGNANRGQGIFYWNEAAQCTRCHAVFEFGGNAGPSLAGVSHRLSREQLLESLISPSATIVAGYAIVSLQLKDGTVITGTVIKENTSSMSLRDSEEITRTISKNDIERRTDVPSSMPSVAPILTKMEIRDLVEYLTTLEKEEG